MSLQVRWTLAASQSLSEVLEYTIENFGERQLRKLTNRINSTISRVELFPYLGKSETVLSELLGLNYRSAVVIKEIKIYYSIMKDVVYIEYVKNVRLDDNTMLNRLRESTRI